MILNDDDKPFSTLTGALKNMQKIDAPAYFEADLMRRIASEEVEALSRKSIVRNFLFPKKFIPALSLGFTVVIIFATILFNSGTPLDNIFSKPALLKSEISNVLLVVEPANDKEIVKFNSQNNSKKVFNANYSSTSLTRDQFNFKQIRLTPEQKEQLRKIKEKLKKIIK